EADARIDHLEIAAHLRRHVQQERGEEVREAAVRRGVARQRGLSRPELKLAARAALILRLQEEVARVTEVFAELDRVVRLLLGEDGREFDRPLRAIPRQARREADERIAPAA